MFDYHVHSTFSVDCAIPMESSCRAAIAAGVTEIAITDHVDHVPADPGYGYYRADEYLREVDRVRDQFSGELTVLRGRRSTSTRERRSMSNDSLPSMATSSTT